MTKKRYSIVKALHSFSYFLIEIAQYSQTNMSFSNAQGIKIDNIWFILQNYKNLRKCFYATGYFLVQESFFNGIMFLKHTISLFWVPLEYIDYF